MDIEDPAGGETSALRGADSDDSEEYIFNIGTQEPQTAKPTFQVRFWVNSEYFKQEGF